MATQWETRLVDEYMKVYSEVDDRTRDELLKEAVIEGALQFDWEHGYTEASVTRTGNIEMRVSSRHYGATVYWGTEKQYALALAGEGWNEDEGEWREVVLTRSGQAGTLLEVMQVLSALEVEFGLEDL